MIAALLLAACGSPVLEGPPPPPPPPARGPSKKAPEPVVVVYATGEVKLEKPDATDAVLEVAEWVASLPAVDPPLSGDCATPLPTPPAGTSALSQRAHIGQNTVPWGRVDGPEGQAWVLSLSWDPATGVHDPFAQRWSPVDGDDGGLDPDRVPLRWGGCDDGAVQWSIDEARTIGIRRKGLALDVAVDGQMTWRPTDAGLITDSPDASDGYVLFAPMLSGTTYLIDRQGRAVHTWNSAYASAAMTLLDDGTLLRSARDPDALTFEAGGVTGIVERLGWDSEVLWSWKHSTPEHVLHHDIEPMPNGHFLALGWEVITPERARAAGRPEALVPEAGLWSDFVIEVEPLPDNQGRIVWAWHAWDHVTAEPAAHPGRIDITADPTEDAPDADALEQMKALGYVDADAEPDDVQSDYLHINAVAYHPELDHIALSVPSFGEVWILDHALTTDEAKTERGDLLYRWGNPRAYRQGEPADQRLHYQHDVRWIPPGHPGEGHLTVFDNGRRRADGRNYSAVVELELPLEDGRYVREGDAPWGPRAPVWQYAAPQRLTFFAPFISGAHRLANGNTFVCAGPQARLFEVTPDRRVVWDYRNPYGGAVPNRDGSAAQPLPPDRQRAVFRATKLPPDHPGLKGRTLAPLSPQPAHDKASP